MPAEIFGEKYEFLARGKLLTFEEITRLTRILVKLGALKIRLTGGEPLVRREMDKLIGMLAGLDGIEDMAMTTNAVFLPQHAQALYDAGLKRITISLDSLDDEVFRTMNGGRGSVEEVLRGLEVAEQVGFSPIKINAVVQRGVNDHTLVDLARFFKDRGHIVRFIEYMDVGTVNGWNMTDVVPAEEILQKIDAELPLERIKPNYPGEVAQRYRFKDGAGEIGIIASVTKPFCGACNRLRLSAEGSLYTCLFATEGTDLRTPLRSGASDDEIESILRNMWGSRTDRYSEERSELTTPRDKIEMYHIGG
jgi:cyclic pyranopterin phosphate synthase